MAEEVLVVLTTWPDVEKARAAARTLVEEKLAACANLVPGVESIYRWQGAVETSAEVLVILKTTDRPLPDAARRASCAAPLRSAGDHRLRATGLDWVGRLALRAGRAKERVACRERGPLRARS